MPNLTLIKNELSPLIKQRVIRVLADARLLQHMTVDESRAVYDELEGARDALSKILDKADGKHV